MTTEVQISALRDPADVSAAVALFLADAGEAYISHSELMFGRADTPTRWSSTLGEQLASEIGELAGSNDPARATICAHLGDELVGVSLVAFEMDVPHPFAVVEDIVVAKTHRQHGIGLKMMDWIRKEARARGCRRLFLESGLGNETVHHFFEHQGFRQVSIVMMSELDG